MVEVNVSQVVVEIPGPGGGSVLASILETKNEIDAAAALTGVRADAAAESATQAEVLGAQAGTAAGNAVLAVTLRTASSMAALRSMATSQYVDAGAVYLNGWNAGNSRGQGVFRWDATSTLPDDGGYVIQPTAVSGAGRLIRALIQGALCPEDFGAVGDGVTDDSPAMAAILNAHVLYGFTIRLGAATYFLSSVTMPRLTDAPSIQGLGPSRSKIVAGPLYRGPVLWLDEIAGPFARDIKAGTMLDSFTLIGTRYAVDTTPIPLGTQHGIVITGRSDVITANNLVIDNFRGYGVSIGVPGLVTSVGYLRESNWHNVRVRHSGAGPAFPQWHHYATSASGDQTNNLWFTSCHSNQGYGAAVSILCSAVRKGTGHIHFSGLQIHGAGESYRDANPESDIDFSSFPIVDINGDVNNLSMTEYAANVSSPDNWTFRIRNTFVKDIAVSSNGVSTTSGSNVARVSLPPLPSRILTNADVSTEKGSPLLRVSWPAHGFQVHNYVTLDRMISEGVRSNVQYGSPVNSEFNGLFPRRDLLIMRTEADAFWCLSRGFATSTGQCNIEIHASAARTMRGTYGIEVSSETDISFDAFSANYITRSPLVVGGAAISGHLLIVGLPDFTVVDVQLSEPATSTETSAFGAPVPLRFVSNSRGLSDIRLSGNISTGGGGFFVEDALFVDIVSAVSVTGQALKVGPRVRGRVTFSALGQEDKYVIDIDPASAHLVSGEISNSFQLPARAASRALGQDQAQALERVLSAVSGSAAERRLTSDGSQTLTEANTWALPGAGVYRFRGTAVAAQTSGSAGTLWDSAAWEWTALVRWDGTAGNVICSTVNGTADAVGTPIAPSESSGGGADWRLKISADTIRNSLSIVGVGAANKNLTWKTTVLRIG